MNDLGRDLDEAGRSIAPNLEAARRIVADRAGGPPAAGADAALPRRRAVWVRSAAITGAVGCAMAAALGTAIALRHTGSPAQPASAVALPVSSTSAPSSANTGPGEPAAVSSASSTGTAVPVTTQTLQTYPPYTATASSSSAAPGSASVQGGNVVITEGTAGPVHVTRGQTVEVDLSPSQQAWGQPQSSNQSVLSRLSGSTSPDGSAHALFRAVADGNASVVSAQAPPGCYPKCLPPQLGWDVTVSVSG